MAVFTLIASITRTERRRLGMKYPPLIYSYSSSPPAKMNIQLLTNYSIYLAALPDLKPFSIVSPVHPSSPKTRVQYENEMVLHKIYDICGQEFIRSHPQISFSVRGRINKAYFQFEPAVRLQSLPREYSSPEIGFKLL